MRFFARIFAVVFWVSLALLTVALTAGTLSGLLSHRFWLCELATHFQFQYVMLLGLIALIFALDGRFRWASFALVVGASAFCYHLLPLYTGSQVDPALKPNLKLLSSNIAFFNEDNDKLLALVREEKPDVILLFEVSPPWLPTLKQLETEYPNFEVRPHDHHSGIAIYSRLPLEEKQIETIGTVESPVVVARVMIGEKPVSLVGIHPDPPYSWQGTLDRNDQLEDLADLLIDQPLPLIVAGDFNTSSWNPVFKRLVEDTGLRDSRRGFGVQNSWSTDSPFLRTTIDHCLVSPKVKVLNRRVGPNIGSDHYPILLDLKVE